MKRIGLIFSVAGALAFTALVLGRRSQAMPLPHPVDPVPVHVEPLPIEQYPTVASNGSIKVEWRLSDPELALGIERDEFLKVDLTGAASPDAARAPVNLAVVLDRSGSMAGEKLENARRAAHALVDRLDERDRLAFITFGSNVTLLFPSTVATSSARSEMHSAIDRIYDMGGTNLSGGLEAGLRQVEAFSSGYAVNRVILMSDGEANEGVVTRAGLSAISRNALRQHVTLSAFGVGADFDEDTMQALAEEGGGNYRFLASGADMEPVFDGELKQLSATVAATPSLHLSLAPGVRVADVFGYSYETEGDGITIHLPDFAAGEHRKVVVQLQPPTNALGSEKLADAKLDYVDLLRGKAQVETAWATSATIVPNQAQAMLHRDRETYAQVARVQAAKVAAHAATLFSAGDVKQAEEELNKGRAQAMQINEIAKDDTLGADLDRIAPAPATIAPAAASSESRSMAGKKMKASAYDAYH